MYKKVLVSLVFILFSTCFVTLTVFGYDNKEEKNKIIVYGDFKCPYCKELEKDIIPKLEKDYINTGKADFQFVNMAFLGPDSIKGSRAGHAVKNIAPNEYLNFQKLMFLKQPDNEREWITNQLIDCQIDKLNISNTQKAEIKKDYKTINSQSWKDARKDQKTFQYNGIQAAPTVFVNGKEIKDVYDYQEYKKYLQ
ncbi:MULTISPECIES: DsbA family protein [Staphylococcus]|nr:DsbA family protein [Staphylococcus epidermidis]MCJ1788145.1 DsbA family protein [Staphylococcus warneri]HEQ3766711.1 DsbA family protein [Streptococcus pyogenes]MBE9430346.1 DsbA family protein [Staphylococcus epidermidis]MCJ1790553.1 DsbA family protein [Staphylococcus warneri]MCJ1793026.1 DsbA family protein [Staphylococcus warneri]